VSTPKMDEVVCAQNLFKREGAKPILQVTVYIKKNNILFSFIINFMFLFTIFNMRKLEFIICFLLKITVSFAQVPQNENGDAIIVNKCENPVYYISMSDSGVFGTINPNETYREQFRVWYTPNNTVAGISIKLSPNQTIASAADMQNALLQSTITQFEYTYNPQKAPGLWYDISNVDGYIFGNTSGWNGQRPWPFQADGLIVEGTSEDCGTVVCPGGNPNSNATCIHAYTHPNDDWVTQTCGNNNSIVLTLCTETSALEEVVNTEVPTNGIQQQSCPS
jgi:hypothetical protein